MSKKYHRVKKEIRQRKKKFYPAKKAKAKLGLNNQDFQKLCIIKGVPPKELPQPYKKKFVNNRGRPKSYYERRDIAGILTDDIRATLLRKKGVAKIKAKLLGRKEVTKFRTLDFNSPEYNVDHIILELYPTFKHALDGIDDTLTTMFLYASFTAGNEDLIDVAYKCREIVIDFMNYVIAAKALRKVFITFKGYYYQANIQGCNVTWIVPHPFIISTEGQSRRAKLIINTSTIFGIKLLQFINFKLYQNIGLIYPPKVKKFVEKIDKRKTTMKSENKLALRCFYNEMRGNIASLNAPLLTTSEEETTDELYETELLVGVFGSKTAAATENHSRTLKQKKLFKGLKFYLGREINRESVTFIIRSAGGEVSWDKSLGMGYSYPEKEETITHQIVDRPEVDQKYLTRNYLQPQWVYDSFNIGLLLPVEDYFVGSPLPPHLSPFEESYGMYEVPDMKKLKLMEEGKIEELTVPTLESDEELEEVGLPTDIKAKFEVVKEIRDKKIASVDKMKVIKGKVVRKNRAEINIRESKESKEISISLMPKKTKKLYLTLKRRELKEERLASKLTRARKAFDELGSMKKDANLRKIIK